MELILWLITLDRRWICNYRPNFRIFALFWLIPLVLNTSMICFILFYLYPFTITIFSKCSLIMLLKTLLCLISSISSLIIIKNILDYSKHQFDQIKKVKISLNLSIENFNRKLINDTSNKKNNPSFSTFYEDYWTSRKTLFSLNGFSMLLISLLQIVWSFVYLINKNEINKINEESFTTRGMKMFIFINAYLQFIPLLPIFFICLHVLVVKFSFVISSVICSSCVIGIYNCLKRKEKTIGKLQYKLDFSDVQKIEVLSE